MIHPVILCGGSGTRLWPRSRATRPKPFLPLVGSRSLFQQTVDRCSDADLFAPPCIVTGRQHVGHVEEQLGHAQNPSIIVEPEGKNTAPAIALAALRLDPDAIMLVCPSDHHIENTDAFRAAATQAAALAVQGRLVAFGIAATRPETGYGYIERAEAVDGGYAIGKFVEKPDLETARRFLESGRHSWNGGIFAFRAGLFLDELTRHRPAMADALRRSVESGQESGHIFRPESGSFARIEGESIDYAIMENTAFAAMVPADMGWSDIGNWDALRGARDHDRSGNNVQGQAELIDCSNVLVESDGPRVSAIGLDNVIIVIDGDDVLVTTSDGARKVGTLKGANSQ